ncbi:MAG: F0F1 ATP synthase subunit B [Alphaproteobacteria bacterium]|nr:F0F1 ATP synthase subunit B [Alphaproteobacteria bacterium]PHX99308.1 MAG: F0F1 ATP synthase subunit B [Rhodospirillaceae bacterium]
MLQDPAFWVGLAFLLVIALIYKPAMKSISASLDGRAALIRTQIEEARKLREDAQALLADYQRKQRDAMAEAERIIQQAKEDATRMRADAEQDLTRSIERRKQQALERIAQTEAQAIAQVRNTAVDVALNAAEALLRDNIAAGQAQTMVDKSIAELSKRLN